MPHTAFKKGDPNRLRVFRGVLMNLIYTSAQGESLNVDDPDTISADMLVSALEMLSSRPADDELRNATRYLEQKEYVKVAWRYDGSGDFNSVKLLAKGMDLVERSIEDAGVLFSIRR